MAKRAAPLSASMRIVVIVGKDHYGVAEQVVALRTTLESQHGELDEFEYDGADASLADVLDELRSYGLIQPHKLVRLDSADTFLTREGHRKALERYAAAPVDHATLLMRAETWRAGNLDKLIAKIGAVVKVEPLSEAAAPAWCVRHATERHDVTLDRQAAALLVNRIGADRMRLDTEIAKLASLAGPGGTVDHAVVAEMVGLSREEQAWSIQAALLEGAAAALRQLRELLQVTRQPRQMETLVMWAIGDLLRKLHAAAQMQRQGVPAGAVSRQLRLWGPTQRPLLECASRLSPDRVATLLREAIETDWRMKRGFGASGRSLEALTVRVADIIGSRPAR